MSDLIKGFAVPDIAPFDPAFSKPQEKRVVPFLHDQLYPCAQNIVPLPPLSGRPRLEPPAKGDHRKSLEELCSHIIDNPENQPAILKKEAGEPVQNDTRNLEKFHDDLNETYTTVSPSEEGNIQKKLPQTPEKILLYFLKLQNKLEEGLLKLSYREIDLQQSQQKQIKEDNFDLKGEIENRKNQSNLLSWINVGLTVSLIAASVALFFATGGASALLTYGMCALGVAQGGTTIAKALVDYDHNAKMGHMFNVNTQQKQIHRLIDDGIDAISQSMHQITDIAKMMRAILDQQLESTKIIFS